jgi:aromatic ring-cleaving dioxygenase
VICHTSCAVVMTAPPTQPNGPIICQSMSGRARDIEAPCTQCLRHGDSLTAEVGAWYRTHPILQGASSGIVGPHARVVVHSKHPRLALWVILRAQLLAIFIRPVATDAGRPMICAKRPKIHVGQHLMHCIPRSRLLWG